MKSVMTITGCLLRCHDYIITIKYIMTLDNNCRGSTHKCYYDKQN